MTQSKIETSEISVLQKNTPRTSVQAERRFRRICAWIALILGFMGALGAVWDREWHAFVGRDQFWTPPHTLIYTSVAGAGLVALFVVLRSSYLFRKQHVGIDSSSTISVFGIFHAPLGFVVAGFGALLALISAPLDNYWHELYGIDIAMWAPFHMMGIVGGLIGILGMVYVFASESTRDRLTARASRTFLGFTALEWGSFIILTELLNFVLTGFLQFPLVDFGSLHVDTYLLPLIAGSIFCFVSASRFTLKPWAATIIVALLLAHTLFIELFIPWAIRLGVAWENLDFRDPSTPPAFSWAYALLPLALLPSSLIVDLCMRRKQGKEATKKPLLQALFGLLLTPTTALITPFVLLSYSPFAPVFLPEAGVPIDTMTYVLAASVSGVVALAMGALWAILGSDFGDIWRWNTR